MLFSMSSKFKIIHSGTNTERRTMQPFIPVYGKPFPKTELRGFISPLCVKHFLLLQQFPLNTLLPCVFQVKLSPFGMGVELDSVYEKRFPPPR